MPTYLSVFLALLLAHFLGDFPLQTWRMVVGKVAFRPSAYLSHGGVHLAMSVAAVVLFTDLPLAGARTWLSLLVLGIGHLALDLGKSRVVRRWPACDGALLYSADQIVHALIIAAVAALATDAAPPVDAVSSWWAARHETVLVFMLIVMGTVFPAGYLIRYLLKPLSNQLDMTHGRPPGDEGTIEGLSNAGLYLGWLERGLLVLAFAIGSFTAVGLIIGAKSIARFPEFRSRAFAEYFLIGTLISVAIAAAGGWILRLSLAAI